MLLTISTTSQAATDLGFLLHKHPDRFQSFDLSFGKVHVFYPEVGAEQCTVCLLLDVDAVGMVRGKNPDQNFLLGQYVNDRPYAASSFMSVAISQVFGSALQGRCKDRPDLAATALPLKARIDVLPVRGGERFLRSVFEPLKDKQFKEIVGMDVSIRSLEAAQRRLKLDRLPRFQEPKQTPHLTIRDLGHRKLLFLGLAPVYTREP